VTGSPDRVDDSLSVTAIISRVLTRGCSKVVRGEILLVTMSRDNVEIVRRLYEAVNSFGIGAAVTFAHPDVEVVPPPNWPEASTLRGREQLQEVARQWMESFEAFEVEPERFVDPGGQRVLVYVRDKGRIRGSDTEIDSRLIHLWTLTAGRVIRWEVFADEAQALEAAGLTA
jgi:ketosteroid isomerase-like protein